MSAWIVTGLLSAAIVFADDYPRPAGFVNDFANQLPVSTVQALEKKVRDYERTTGNEIVVAVAPSLNGMLVDDYARGLFHAWGVGKPAVNNGVLFLWAPKERRIRIEVGIGLQGALTDVAAGRIVMRVRDLFRRERYADGVDAAVDGIIQVLGTSRAAGAAPDGLNFVERHSPEALERQRQAEAQRQADEARRQQEEDADRAASGRTRLIDFGLAALLGVGLYMIYRLRRAARLRAELPRELASADQFCSAADRKKAEAQAALAELRKEAPDEVYRLVDAALSSTADELERQRSDLQRLRSTPRLKYAELKAAHQALRSWHARMAATVMSLEEVAGTSEKFRAQREEARRMLASLPPKLARVEAERTPGSSEGLLPAAAAETYNHALQKSQEQPANWLLIYDLLADVSECLEQIENPSVRMPYQRARYWSGDTTSPAASALAMFYASQATLFPPVLSQAANSSDDDVDWGSSGAGSGGGSGDGDSGGSGGGDSGGGGASSDY